MALKEFINSHREEFEEDFPDDLWKKIDAKLPNVAKKSIWLNSKIIRFAAGIIICLSIGFWFGKYYRNDSSLAQQDKMLSTQPALVTYTETVLEKRETLNSLIISNPELQKAFVGDLEDLQKNFEFLKSQLTKNPNHEQLIEAMKQNLEWQIDLLNKQTEIAQNVKKYEVL
ncbi:hypothetical protein EGI22_23540 [Lacihabitans sp. LS3-19]|uniref:hypothetical protein n=1 Tax=Lacihabitans sp. LS3-19 TaxID=2487335 RepID=UPI0020CF7B53|nr:hypothetical protein [Lacihabitans sp. LS3-19]MCP9770889.1 hypothetical protein [Lacihabitans sp. LS3-19]